MTFRLVGMSVYGLGAGVLVVVVVILVKRLVVFLEGAAFFFVDFLGVVFLSTVDFLDGTIVDGMLDALPKVVK